MTIKNLRIRMNTLDEKGIPKGQNFHITTFMELALRLWVKN